MSLEAKNIRKSFGTNHVLRDVSVYAKPGTITTIIGPSGTGKTTLLRALAMTDVPDAGQICVDEQCYLFPQAADKKLSPVPWPKVTVVFQQLFLWPHISLRENILLPARNFPRDTMTEELNELIDVLEMQEFINHFPNEASLGQRQRVALARALMLQPRYVLMDEVTSALDVEQVANILDFLPKIRERGIGVLLITHALGFARRAADSILFMDGGKIVERGGVDLLDHPQTSRLQQFLSLVQSTT